MQYKVKLDSATWST